MESGERNSFHIKPEVKLSVESTLWSAFLSAMSTVKDARLVPHSFYAFKRISLPENRNPKNEVRSSIFLFPNPKYPEIPSRIFSKDSLHC